MVAAERRRPALPLTVATVHPVDVAIVAPLRYSNRAPPVAAESIMAALSTVIMPVVFDKVALVAALDDWMVVGLATVPDSDAPEVSVVVVDAGRVSVMPGERFRLANVFEPVTTSVPVVAGVAMATVPYVFPPPANVFVALLVSVMLIVDEAADRVAPETHVHGADVDVAVSAVAPIVIDPPVLTDIVDIANAYPFESHVPATMAIAPPPVENASCCVYVPPYPVCWIELAAVVFPAIVIM